MKLLHALLGILYASMFLGKSHKTRNLILRGGMVFHLKGERGHLGVVRRVYSIDNRQRELALSHVVAGGLAYLRRVIIVENIIANLEYHAQVLSKLLRLGNVFVAGTGREGTNAAARLKQRRRLLLYNIIVDLLRDVTSSDV